MGEINVKATLLYRVVWLLGVSYLFAFGVHQSALAQEPSWAYEKWGDEASSESDARVTAKKGLKGMDLLQRLTISGYGTMNYHNYLQHDLDPYTRNKIDMEKFSLYMHYRLLPKLRLFTEVEYEHGGTGASMEFDALEEAGEFEIEIEQGGEVKLEALYLDFAFHPLFNLRVGRAKIGVGLCNNFDRPNKHFTTTRIEGESTMIPSGWYETGPSVWVDVGQSTELPIERHEWAGFIWFFRA